MLLLRTFCPNAVLAWGFSKPKPETEAPVQVTGLGSRAGTEVGEEGQLTGMRDGAGARRCFRGLGPPPAGMVCAGF